MAQQRGVFFYRAVSAVSVHSWDLKPQQFISQAQGWNNTREMSGSAVSGPSRVTPARSAPLAGAIAPKGKI